MPFAQLAKKRLVESEGWGPSPFELQAPWGLRGASCSLYIRHIMVSQADGCRASPIPDPNAPPRTLIGGVRRVYEGLGDPKHNKPIHVALFR